MNSSDFRRLALSLEGAEEGSHMGAVDFRVGGRIFATLAAVKQGYGKLMLTPEHQAAFVAEGFAVTGWVCADVWADVLVSVSPVAM